MARNRLKRVAREAFRLRRLSLPHYDIVFRQIAKVDLKDPKISIEIEQLFQRLVDAEQGS